MADGFNVIQLFYGGEVAEGKVFSPLPIYCSMICFQRVYYRSAILK